MINQETLEAAVELRHQLHAHPELSYNESWTKQTLYDFLKERTKLRLEDRGRWFYAVYEAGEGKPSIAFRADFDALPIEETCVLPYSSRFAGVSHKCGHDGHAANLAAFAMEVDRLGADKNVFFLFQHAEETGRGAAECCDMFRENTIDEVYAFHCMPGYPFGAAVVIDGPCHNASSGMIMRFTGKKSHASMPEKGVNPAWAIARLIGELPDIYSAEKYSSPVLATIIEVSVGEKAFGTSAGYGELSLTVRAELEEDMYKLRDGIIAAAQALCAEYGLGFEYSMIDTFPQTFNDKRCMDKVRRACAANGVPVVEKPHPSKGSEDFGHYQKLVPGAIFHIGDGEDAPPIHTGDFDFPDALIPIATGLFRTILEQ